MADFIHISSLNEQKRSIKSLYRKRKDRVHFIYEELIAFANSMLFFLGRKNRACRIF